MRILILEDDSNRINQFYNNFSEDNKNEISVVQTAKEAITLLNCYVYDALFLDHDLGGEQLVDSSMENCGYTVAKWLEEHNEYIPDIVLIHSFNPYGARKMNEAIYGSHLFPGLWEKKINDVFITK